MFCKTSELQNQGSQDQKISQLSRGNIMIFTIFNSGVNRKFFMWLMQVSMGFIKMAAAVLFHAGGDSEPADQSSL